MWPRGWSVDIGGAQQGFFDAHQQDRFVADLTGAGIYYGAAMTEALSCRGEHVYVVGAGNSAGQAAVHFARRCAVVPRITSGPSRT